MGPAPVFGAAGLFVDLSKPIRNPVITLSEPFRDSYPFRTLSKPFQNPFETLSEPFRNRTLSKPFHYPFRTLSDSICQLILHRLWLTKLTNVETPQMVPNTSTHQGLQDFRKPTSATVKGRYAMPHKAPSSALWASVLFFRFFVFWIFFLKTVRVRFLVYAIQKRDSQPWSVHGIGTRIWSCRPCVDRFSKTHFGGGDL